MTVWAMCCRVGAASVVLGTAFAFHSLTARAAEPAPARPAKPTPAQIRALAEKAEQAGEWEAAFDAYCHLFILERPTPELREKLNGALRRVQQLRRHRDPAFQQYASGMALTDGLTLFAEVVHKVPAVYAERDKATPQRLWASAVEELDRALGNPVFRQAFLDNPRPDRVEAFRTELRRDWAKRTISDHKKAREALRQLINAAQDALPVRAPGALAVECASGACSGLDEFTVFLAPTQGGSELSAIPDLTAAGIYLAQVKGALVVDGIVPNSWAALHTGLRRGDRITRVNGREMKNPVLPAAAAALRAPIDGFHELEIAAAGEGPALMFRVPAKVPTVFGTQLVSKDVGYIRIATFATTTPGELDEAIATLKSSGARAIILDLRGNHGGSFLAGVETARRVLPAGVIVTTHGQVSEVDNKIFTSASGASAHDIPLVVMLDAETASAAEVFAAALKDNGRATLVGMPSFGKGSIQYPLKLVTLDEPDPMGGGKRPGKTGTVRVTIAKLIAPSGTPINGSGIQPHFLEPDPTLQREIAIDKATDILAGTLRPMMMMPVGP